MSQFNIKDHPHRRYNPLLDRWVLVAPHRAKRPWKGAVEKSTTSRQGNTNVPPDLSNPLCPGARRGNGEINPDYKSTFIFPNDFPSLLPDTPSISSDQGTRAQNEEHTSPKEPEDPLFRFEPARGECHVLCFDPRSYMTLARMTPREIERVLDAQVELFEQLARKWAWVQMFENRGEMMGCSNPHPHCQCWSTEHLPNEALAEHRSQLAYLRAHRRPLLVEYAEREAARAERVVLENAHWLVLVPYWASWPFETLLLPRAPLHLARLSDIRAQPAVKADLASILKGLLTIYDNLFECSFPYSMGWHGAPTGAYMGPPHEHTSSASAAPTSTSAMPDSAGAGTTGTSSTATEAEECASAWQLHAHFYPPLLRSATVRKYMVGYEMLAEPQRDLTPEAAVQTLRQQSSIKHFLDEPDPQ